MAEDSGSKPTPGEDPAVTALKRLARPQPKAFDAPVVPASGEVPGGAVGSGSATGFVGSLAKPVGAPLPGDTMVGGRVKKGDPIQMAREVVPKRPASPLAEIAKAAEEAEVAAEGGAGSKDSPAVPESSAAMAYVMMGIAVVLVVIGCWAVGALMYMRTSQPLSPRDVTYPLVAWEISVEKGGAYTRSSVAMAWAMLLCLPVSVVLLVMGWKLRPRHGAVAQPGTPADAKTSL